MVYICCEGGWNLFGIGTHRCHVIYVVSSTTWNGLECRYFKTFVHISNSERLKMMVGWCTSKKLCGLRSPEAVSTVTKAVITPLKWKIAPAPSNTARSSLAVAPVCRVAELLLAQVSHVLAESLSAVAICPKHCRKIKLHGAGLSLKGRYITQLVRKAFMEPKLANGSSWASWIHSPTSHPICVRIDFNIVLSSHLLLVQQSEAISWCDPINILWIFFISSCVLRVLSVFFVLDFNYSYSVGEEYKLWSSLVMKFLQPGLLRSWTCGSSDIVKEHNVSESASVSVLGRAGGGGGAPLTQLGPLERVNLVVHWSRLVTSNGPNWIGSTHPHPKPQITTRSCIGLGSPLIELTCVLCL
jgi:hypothetical protein